MEMKKLVQGMTVAGLMIFAGNSFAALSQGSLGATSTGTVDVEVTVNWLVRISGLSQMTGNVYVPGSPVTDSTTACIYRNGSVNYEITASSANGSGTDFFLSDTVNNVVYDVTFDDGSGSGAVDLNHTATNSTFVNANTTIDDCSAGAGGNATIAVSIPELGAGPLNGLAEVPAATYADVLTVTVAPR